MSSEHHDREERIARAQAAKDAQSAALVTAMMSADAQVQQDAVFHEPDVVGKLWEAFARADQEPNDPDSLLQLKAAITAVDQKVQDLLRNRSSVGKTLQEAQRQIGVLERLLRRALPYVEQYRGAVQVAGYSGEEVEQTIKGILGIA